MCIWLAMKSWTLLRDQDRTILDAPVHGVLTLFNTMVVSQVYYSHIWILHRWISRLDCSSQQSALDFEKWGWRLQVLPCSRPSPKRSANGSEHHISIDPQFWPKCQYSSWRFARGLINQTIPLSRMYVEFSKSYPSASKVWKQEILYEAYYCAAISDQYYCMQWR